jgi:hypothetical protein
MQQLSPPRFSLLSHYIVTRKYIAAILSKTAKNSREIKIPQDEEEKCASYKDIIVVLGDIIKGNWSGLSHYNSILVLLISLLTPRDIPATLITK